jgi:hypothetical protein
MWNRKINIKPLTNIDNIRCNEPRAETSRNKLTEMLERTKWKKIIKY